MRNVPRSMSLADRISYRSTINEKTGCHEWTGCCLRGGYGLIRYGGKDLLVHRVSYELAYGPIPRGAHIDHLCRVRNCCNSKHLEAVTPQENIRRGEAGINQRRKPHCPKGHEYTPNNLDASSLRRGERYCKICKNANNRAYEKRKKSSQTPAHPV